MNTTIHREGDRAWLEGVSGWSPGERESSVHAAQAAVMEALGENVGYVDLLGASGLAFRMQVSQGGLCPSSPHAFCGYQCVAGSIDALPWEIRVYEVKEDDEEAVRAARQAVVESIDRGVPVQYGSEEDGVVVGYQEDGAGWICFHPFHEGGAETFVETRWPWGIAVFTGPKESASSRRDLAAKALRQAVAMSETKEVEGYTLGFRAWDDYIANLRGLQEAGDEARQGAMLGNSWIYECLVQYRRAASAYLRDVAGEFAAEAAGHLRRAADLYEEMATRVLSDGDHCVLTVAPLPWSLKEGVAWTDGMRAEQIRRLEAALPLEREAIGEIKRGIDLDAGELA